MLCIRLNNPDPYFCLATEEFLLKNSSEEIFMLWQSHDTVVVGKHQNTMGEIDYRYVRENGIKVARRISGGGTVFHDRGNVNFTYIKNVSGPGEISFRRFTQPIVDALAEMGIEVSWSGRNDLMVSGKKVSGNAEHVYKNRVLHHGTLLYDSNLQNLGNAIRVVPGKYTGKAVQSNRSVVANISAFMNEPVPVEDFIERILQFQLAQSSENCIYSFSDEDILHIKLLSAGKFETWDWQFGYSPACSFLNELNTGQGTALIKAEIAKSHFTSVQIEGSFYPDNAVRSLSRYLTGKPHLYETVYLAHAEAGMKPELELIYAWF
jgi:lipoate---protein ligase